MPQPTQPFQADMPPIVTGEATRWEQLKNLAAFTLERAGTVLEFVGDVTQHPKLTGPEARTAVDALHGLGEMIAGSGEKPGDLAGRLSTVYVDRVNQERARQAHNFNIA